jgi:hypothetical protein
MVQVYYLKLGHGCYEALSVKLVLKVEHLLLCCISWHSKRTEVVLSLNWGQCYDFEHIFADNIVDFDANYSWEEKNDRNIHF